MRNIELQNALDRSMSGLQFREEMKAAAALVCTARTETRSESHPSGSGGRAAEERGGAGSVGPSQR